MARPTLTWVLAAAAVLLLAAPASGWRTAITARATTAGTRRRSPWPAAHDPAGVSPAGESPLFRPSVREADPPPPPKCRVEAPFGRALTIAGSAVGNPEDSIIDDPSGAFLTDTLGLRRSEVRASAKAALEFFHDTYGIHLPPPPANAGTSSGPGWNVTSKDGAVLMTPFEFKLDLPITADSKGRVECGDAVARVGGWVVEGENLTLHGAWGGRDGVTLEGESILLYAYLVFPQPRRTPPTIVRLVTRAPLMCAPSGGCAIAADTVLDDRVHPRTEGTATGVLFFEDAAEEGLATTVRMTLVWPATGDKQPSDGRPPKAELDDD